MRPASTRRSLWLTALVTTFVLAGCSGAQPGSAVADTSDGGGDDGGTDVAPGGGGALCSILTEEEVASIAGVDVTATDFEEGDCDYTIGDADNINLRFESSFDPNLEVARLICDGFEDVSGVGDQAIWCPNLNVLFFNKGDKSLAVQLIYMLAEPSRELKDIATDLATEAANGL